MKTHQLTSPLTVPYNVDQLLQQADWLRRFARALVKDGNEAEDVAQETWIALGHAPVPAGVSSRHWLAGIAKNVVRNRRKSAARRNAHEAGASGTREHASTRSPLEDSELLERQRLLLNGIEALPEAQRRALIARFYDGKMPRIIAEEEGVAVSTIHSRIQRGLEQLRSDLDAEYGSRRAWALVIAPVAAPLPGEAAAAAGVFSVGTVIGWAVAAALVLGLGGLAWLSFRGSDSDLGSPGQLASGAPQDAESSADSTSKLPAKVVLDRAPSLPASRSTAPGAGQRPLSIVHQGTGEVAAGATVIALTEPEAQAAAAAIVETHQELGDLTASAFMAGFGEEGTADAAGQFEILAAENVLVLASTEDAMGFGIMKAGDPSPTLSLTRAGALTVHLRQRSGAPYTESPTRPPLPIAAILKTERPGSAYETAPFFQSARQVSRGGVVRFQNPWFGQKLDGVEPGPDAPYQYSIETVYIDAPGVGEYEPSARATGRFRPFDMLPGEKEREITVPDMGSLEIQLTDAGALADVDGMVSVTFPGKTLGAPYSNSYERSIKGGKARFPLFVLGGRPFEARISLPKLGAAWTVKETGPVSRSEPKRLRLPVPKGAAITARLVDESGLPEARANVQLQHSRHATHVRMGMTGFLAGQTDAKGAVRFEIPKGKDLAPPFTLKAARYASGQIEETFSFVELSDVDLKRGKDLGEITLPFVAPTTVTGTVLDGQGRPFPGAHLTIEAPGHFSEGLRADAEGRFSTNRCLFGNEVLTASSNDGRYVDQHRTLADIDLSHPIELQLHRGATFRAAIDCGGIDAPKGLLRMRLDPANPSPDGSQDPSWAEDQGQGVFLRPAVAAGTYSAALLLSGPLPLAEVHGVEIGDSGEESDPRVDGLRLTDFVREIEVTWEDPSAPGEMRQGKGRPTLSVNTPDAGGEDRLVNYTSGDEPYLLPLHLPASATFELPGGLTHRVADATAIDDTLHIVFSAPSKALIRIVSPAPKDLPEGTTWLLQGESGTSAEGAWVSLKASEVEAKLCKVEFPAPGRYRLHRVAPPVEEGSGMWSATPPEPTVEVIEFAPGSGAKPPTISLALDAGLVRD